MSLRYEYRCRTCGTTKSETNAEPKQVLEDPCINCGAAMKRVYGISIMRASAVREHWNRALGQPVSSMQDFKRKAREASERYEEDTGIPANYTVVEPGDRDAAFGRTDAGLDATNRELVSSGQLDTKFYA